MKVNVLADEERFIVLDSLRTRTESEPPLILVTKVLEYSDGSISYYGIFLEGEKTGVRVSRAASEVNVIGKFADLVQSANTVRNLSHVLDLIWGIVYPDESTWEYPAQVYTHLKLWLEEMDTKLNCVVSKLEKAGSNSHGSEKLQEL